jgi:transposase-like protein
MIKCPHCLSLDGKSVNTKPHSKLADKLVLTQIGGGGERYVCKTCQTRWWRKRPNAASSAQDYSWIGTP